MLRRLFDALRGRGAGEGDRWRVGGLYAIAPGADGYRIAKVLACDARVVHLKLYGRRFRSVSQWLEPGDLAEGVDLDALCSGEPVALGIAHLPMDARGFAAAGPRWIQDAPVTADERAAMVEALETQAASAGAGGDGAAGPRGADGIDDGRA